jgi:hypothetical protein
LELNQEATAGTGFSKTLRRRQGREEGAALPIEINRLTDQLRAVEGQLMQVRKTGRCRVL